LLRELVTGKNKVIICLYFFLLLSPIVVFLYSQGIFLLPRLPDLTLNSPFSKFVCFFFFKLHFFVVTKIEQFEGVIDQVLFNFEV
jgi:hypothetical protein